MVPLQVSEVYQHLALTAVNSLRAIVLSFHGKDQRKNAADQPGLHTEENRVKYQESQKFHVSHSCDKDVLTCNLFVCAIYLYRRLYFEKGKCVLM